MRLFAARLHENLVRLEGLIHVHMIPAHLTEVATILVAVLAKDGPLGKVANVTGAVLEILVNLNLKEEEVKG